jgi:NAD(P)H dehydrogenase (quinone)
MYFGGKLHDYSTVLRAMNTLIVYAHPEPQSFTAALKNCALTTLSSLGHDVIVSDLYAMNFNPVAGPNDMRTTADRSYFHLQVEQNLALRDGTFSDDIRREQEKVLWAKVVIFQFPMWWYSVPAIAKGWIDRVLSYGFAYGAGTSLKGRKALLSLTTGGPEHSYQPETRGTVDLLLKHLTDGTFRLCGMETLPPFVAYAAARTSQEQRQEYLHLYAERLREITASA